MDLKHGYRWSVGGPETRAQVVSGHTSTGPRDLKHGHRWSVGGPETGAQVVSGWT